MTSGESSITPITDWSMFHEIAKGNSVLFLAGGFADSTEYPDIIWEIAVQAKHAAHNLTVSWFDSYDVSVNRFRIKETKNQNQVMVTEKNYLKNLSKILDVQLDFEEVDPRKDEEIELLFSEGEELERSIHSVWMSRNIRTGSMLLKKRKDFDLYEFDKREYLRGRRLIKENFSKKHYDIVIVPNGRFPFQVGLKHESQRYSARVFYWERGFRHTRKVFLQNFQTQDMDFMNAYLLALKNKATQEERQAWHSWASNWLLEQEFDPSKNPFLVKGVSDDSMRKGLSLQQLQSTGFVPIFTSSLDERMSNLVYDMNEWSNQTEAIVWVTKALSQRGNLPYVRLHPNLGWKSFRELIETVRELIRNKIAFQLPWENPSSYKLLSKASFVITWGSTISLESTARGIPTLNMGRTRFDSLIDVELLNRSGLESNLSKLPVNPDKLKSLEAIFLTRNYGLPLENSERKPEIEILFLEDKILAKKFRNLLVLIRQVLSSMANTSPNLVYISLRKLIGIRVATIIMRKTVYAIARFPRRTR